MSNPDPKPRDITLLTIGVVAELTGRRPSSIRYYEEIGLLASTCSLSDNGSAQIQVVYLSDLP